ncbi:MFS transporter [Macrococcus sp. DPC7161]|uniref:lipoteichoic acid biosynthesis MFS flippase LtaA n=1 Tax=Macrococcus sp. DPC7161 TaxID=2507060 RepID=UPI00100ADA14|nr:MFS transporter [Macrococcus sp. DPC7161]RXK18776.1 MFS transporter [Macrococcus sp. DPC7161]
MQNLSQNKYISGKNFWFMLIILFLMEFARGMYILSYLTILPTNKTGITVGIVSVCISLHFIFDALTNFTVGFLLKRYGTKRVLNFSFLFGFIGLGLIVFFTTPMTLIFAAIVLGIAVCPIWVIMLSSVNDNERTKQMGYVYFAWLVGMIAGMIGMNLLIKVHPTHFSFLMPLFILIAWILYFFVNVEVSYIEKKSLKVQLNKIYTVARRHMNLFPGILFQGLAIGMLVPILPTFAMKHLNVTTLEYTYILIAGGFGCTISMLFISKIMDQISKKYTYGIILLGFIVYGSLIFYLTTVTNYYIACAIAFTIGIFYGLLLPGWNAFMASEIHEQLKEETWGVFNSIQGIGTMLGPIIGGLITEIFRESKYTFYVSGSLFIFLACFYTIYFIKHRSTLKKDIH